MNPLLDGFTHTLSILFLIYCDRLISLVSRIIYLSIRNKYLIFWVIPFLQSKRGLTIWTNCVKDRVTLKNVCVCFNAVLYIHFRLFDLIKFVKKFSYFIKFYIISRCHQFWHTITISFSVYLVTFSYVLGLYGCVYTGWLKTISTFVLSYLFFNWKSCLPRPR